ncbi:glycosyltransferase family 4 protein [Candidatus Babeliales bacterium]|nr:glycosyltransferase family 4 protein [Candidatus Babeliales bacterium]
MQSLLSLEIIGDGEQRKMIETWIRDHKLEDQIILHGWQKNVDHFLHTWDIFSLSSLWEGLPCAVVEARLARLPVVAYDVGGISEIIKNGENGYLVKPGDWRGLSDRLFDLIHEQSLYQKCTEYDDRLDPFYRETMVQEHLKLYRSFLEKNK